MEKIRGPNKAQIKALEKFLLRQVGVVTNGLKLELVDTDPDGTPIFRVVRVDDSGQSASEILQ